ncbi:FIG140336: TPR domain protein [uncultured Rubrobacteraceae bacterium]|uniref:FIG140336: TPR domain protein n=1 Tax=uncultured Rubrobacteraceae bacterium TaxID=349277 RepID=A0A6J4NZT1_9ACTN|nr:FIG140336: TPR domain protein [uncultured Rubrobacteraceae bacterium]
MLKVAKATLQSATGALRSKVSRQARRQLALKDAEIAALRRELARLRGGEDPPGSATGPVPVFFVVGNQKSGTTWLMRMLDAHPEVLCKGEGRFFGASWRQKSLKHRDVLRPASSLYNAVLDAEYLRLWIERSVWSRNDDAGEHLDNLTRMAIDYFLEGELLKSGKRVVGDKSPLLTPETIREISAIYPEARVVHIIRDGRDVAVSAAHHSRNFGRAGKRDPSRGPEGSMFPEGQLEKLAAEWASRVGRAVQDGPELLGENYAEVRYENLLRSPEAEFRRLLDLLGVGSGEGTVRRCVDAASFERLSRGRERGEEDSSSFFRKGVAGDWKNVFTQRDGEIFEEQAGELLVELGYAEDRRPKV